jgi:hypothetical protein
MAKYHGNNDRNSPIVLFQYREMCEDISKTGSDKRWWDYRELYNSREVSAAPDRSKDEAGKLTPGQVRYRSMLVIIMGKCSTNALNFPLD